MDHGVEGFVGACQRFGHLALPLVAAACEAEARQLSAAAHGAEHVPLLPPGRHGREERRPVVTEGQVGAPADVAVAGVDLLCLLLRFFHLELRRHVVEAVRHVDLGAVDGRLVAPVALIEAEEILARRDDKAHQRPGLGQAAVGFVDDAAGQPLAAVVGVRGHAREVAHAHHSAVETHRVEEGLQGSDHLALVDDADVRRGRIFAGEVKVEERFGVAETGAPELPRLAAHFFVVQIRHGSGDERRVTAHFSSRTWG